MDFEFFFSVSTSEDGSSTGQFGRRAENDKVQDIVDKWFLQNHSQGQPLSETVVCEIALISARFKYVKRIVC